MSLYKWFTKGGDGAVIIWKVIRMIVVLPLKRTHKHAPNRASARVCEMLISCMKQVVNGVETLTEGFVRTFPASFVSPARMKHTCASF